VLWYCVDVIVHLDYLWCRLAAVRQFWVVSVLIHEAENRAGFKNVLGILKRARILHWMKEGLALDLDETTWPTLSEFIPHGNAKYGTNVNIDQVTRYRWWEYFGTTKQEIFDEWFRWSDQNVKKYENTCPPLFPDTIRALSDINTHFDISAITDREPRVDAETKLYCRYLRSAYDNTSLIPEERIFSTEAHGMDKAALCKLLGIRKAIDDSASVAQRYIEEGIHVYMMTRKWNEEFLREIGPHPLCTPVRDLTEAAHLLSLHHPRYQSLLG
jgi:hypothetical protein